MFRKQTHRHRQQRDRYAGKGWGRPEQVKEARPAAMAGDQTMAVSVQGNVRMLFIEAHA